MVPIREDYQTYEPPVWVSKTVARLLDSLTNAHVAGLSAVVLTESSKVGKGKSRRVGGRKYHLNTCLGLYQRRRAGEPAVIVLVVDNILSEQRSVQWLQLARDAIVGNVLFHEVGHHLHATVGSHARGNEASADAWERRLSRIHFRKRYWYLRLAARPMSFVLRQLLAWRQQRVVTTQGSATDIR